MGFGAVPGAIHLESSAYSKQNRPEIRKCIRSMAYRAGTLSRQRLARELVPRSETPKIVLIVVVVVLVRDL